MNSKNLLKNQLKSGVYSGGDGSSKEEAIVINIDTTPEGIEAEYEYLRIIFGIEYAAWELVFQELHHIEERQYDVLEIKLYLNDSCHKIYFDVTNFFGKY